MSRSSFLRCEELRQDLYQPRNIVPKPISCPNPFVQVELVFSFDLHIIRHYCSYDYFTALNFSPLSSEKICWFDLCIFRNHALASRVLRRMLSDLLEIMPGVFAFHPNSPEMNYAIDEIIQYGHAMTNCSSSWGAIVMPLHARITGTLVQHVSNVNEEDLIQMVLTTEDVNYSMIPTEESSIKKLKVQKVKLEGEDCTICLEEMELGSDASEMPCHHSFHGSCIETWLKQSHYCPICRFQMPTADEVLN